MSFDGTDFEVQFEVGTHQATGQVYANFYSINPATGLPPSVDVGFLPPEDGTGRGQGHFTYVVKPLPGLTPGTEIRNVAEITFDFGETIATNQIDPHDPSQGTDPDKEALNTIAPETATLTVGSTIGGSVSGPGEGAFVYDWGSSVGLSATPGAGSAFVKWTGGVVTVSDVNEASSTIGMYEDFAVTAKFAPLVQLQLKKGFNLISIPANVTSQPDLQDWLPVLGDSSEIEKVGVHDEGTGQFVTLIPEDPSNPSFAVQPGEGLIVHAKQDKQLTFDSIRCASHDLVPGANLVGFPCAEGGYSAFQLLSDLGSGNAASVQRFSVEDGRFDTAVFEPGGDAAGVDFPIVPGEGYLVFMSQEVLGFGF